MLPLIRSGTGRSISPLVVTCRSFSVTSSGPAHGGRTSGRPPGDGARKGSRCGSLRAAAVRYFTAADLVETLYRGLADNTVGKIIESLLRVDLIILDELGFAPLDDTPQRSCCSGSSLAPTNADPWPSARTGPFKSGADSCQSRPPPSASSTASCTTPPSSSPTASPTA